MKKKMLSLILALVMVLSLAACGGKEVDNSANNAAGKEGVFDYEDLTVLTESVESESFNVSQLKVIDDTLYIIADVSLTNGYQLCYLTADMDGNVKTNSVIYEQIWEEADYAEPMPKAAVAIDAAVAVPDVAVTETAEEEEGWHNLYGYQILSDGRLAYVDNYGKNNSETGMYEETYYIVVCDVNGQELSKTNISENLEEEEYIYINSLVQSEADTLYVLCYEKIFEVALEGGILGEIDTNEITQSLYTPTFYKDGYPVFAIWDNESGTENYATVDIRKGEIVEEINLMPNIMNYSCYDGSNSGYDLILAGSNGVYGYNVGDEEATKLMDYINSNLPTYRIRNICFKDSENFIAVYNDIVEYDSHIASFTKVAPENVPDREVMTLATFGTGTDLRTAVIDFNKSSDKYKILIKDYSEYNTYEDWEAGITKLNNDIISGNIPDIIQCSESLPLENYASKGMLANFYELMENDETIKREDYAENVFKAYEIDGELYELPTMFYIWTVFGKTSIFGEDTSLTWEELKAVQAQYPEAEVFSEMTKENALRNSLIFSYSQLVDEATGECRFNSDEFKKILEYANTYPEEINWDELYSDEDYWSKYESRYIENRTLLFQNTIYTIYDAWNYGYRNFLEDSTPVGFPTDNGQGSVLAALESYAISAKSANVDGAWDFVRQFITRDAQMMPEDAERYEYWGLPVLKEAIEQQAMTITQKPFWIDENGEKVEYDETVYINDQEVVMEPATEEEAQAWVDFILSVDKKGGYDYEQAMEIISEEVAGYFSGQKSVDDVAGVIQSRMDIFISESR